MRSSKLIIKSNAHMVMAKFGFGRRFHDLKYFEVGFFSHIPRIQWKLEGIITKNCRKTHSM